MWHRRPPVNQTGITENLFQVSCFLLMSNLKTNEGQTMSPKAKIIVGLIIALVFAPCLSASQKAQTKVTIRAQLFYDATGTFSDDILTRKDLALWNTIIGEGSAGGPSTSTFVTVEISGRHLAVGATKVEITASGTKKGIIQKRVLAVDIYDERTKFFAPMWLHDTGCDPIKISARLIGAGAPATVVTRRIPFECGE